MPKFKTMTKSRFFKMGLTNRLVAGKVQFQDVFCCGNICVTYYTVKFYLLFFKIISIFFFVDDIIGKKFPVSKIFICQVWEIYNDVLKKLFYMRI